MACIPYCAEHSVRCTTMRHCHTACDTQCCAPQAATPSIPGTDRLSLGGGTHVSFCTS